jgi:hypothetical protein
MIFLLCEETVFYLGKGLRRSGKKMLTVWICFYLGNMWGNQGSGIGDQGSGKEILRENNYEFERQRAESEKTEIRGRKSEIGRVKTARIR